MSKRQATVELDEALLEAAQMEAHRSGRTESAVIEDALRQHFESCRPSVLDRIWARNASDALSENEAMALAVEELRAMREERQGLKTDGRAAS